MIEKKHYAPPLIKVLHVELEQGIVAQSADLLPGNIDKNTPEVENWDFKQEWSGDFGI
jgi:hypothetical protein